LNWGISIYLNLTEAATALLAAAAAPEFACKNGYIS